MRRFHIAAFLILLAQLQVLAQQTFSARVVDDQTGEPLPCVSIYVSEGRGTLTNDEGDFTLKMEPEDVMHIRCVGYYSQALKARSMGNVIRLKPLTIELHEVSVRPVDDDKLLGKVVALLKKDFKKAKKHRSRYFSRSVIVNKDSSNAEMLEALMDIGSAVNLHDFAILNGKLSQDQADEWEEMEINTTNIHYGMEVAPMVCATSFWKRAIFPLNDLKANSQYYDISSVFITGEEGERICRIDMLYNGTKPKNRPQGTPILSGSIFVNADTYRLLRFDGYFDNLNMTVFHESQKVERDKNRFHMEFQHRNGFTEVAHSVQQVKTQDLALRSLIFNVDEMEFLQLKGKEGKKKAMGRNFKEAITAAGLDSILWEHSGIVKRTAHEEFLAFGAEAGVPIIKKRHLPTPDSASVADAKLKALRDNLWTFANKRPQEKVYLHMDNTSYFQGDTIWFAAYTQRTDFNIPSNISNVLYAELYDNDGYLVERKIIEMKKGWGRGQFVLDRPIQHSGFYELRAYTRWQLNWGGFEHKHGPVASRWFLTHELEHNYYRDYDKLYSRVFPVYDRPKVEGDFSRDMTLRPMLRYYRRDPNRRRTVLSLFPEGGNLVAGVPNRVAFEAAWSDGEQLEGNLTAGAEEIPAVNRGRGVFTITPERGKEREISFTTKDGKKVSAKLPKPEERGVVLNVKQAGDEWIITTSAVGLDPDSLALTVMHEGVMEKFAALNKGPENEYSSLTFPSSSLPAGIHQVTVFDTQGRVWADRLFFVTKPELAKPTLSISGLKGEYKPYEKIELQVTAATPLPSREGPGVGLSLSVRDGYQQDQLFDNGNIMTEMLLSSELKGFIPNPGWYFEKDDENHRQALDLLMMTQGWRRFDWREMAVKGEWEQSQPREKAQVLRGIIHNFDAKSLRQKKRELRRSQKKGLVDTEIDPPLEKGYEDSLHVEEDPGLPGIDKQLKEERLKTLQATAAGRNPIDYILVSQIMTNDGLYRFNLPEQRISNNHFEIQLPRFYGEYEFRALAKKYNRIEDAANKKKGNGAKYYEWNEIDRRNRRNDMQTKRVMKKKKELGLEIDQNDNLVLLDRPWTRFVKPYTFYQSHISDSPERRLMEPTLLADSIHQLSEVSVSVRFGGLRRFDDSQPAFKIRGDEAENMMADAGIILGMPDQLGRTLFGDMGFDYPYIASSGSTQMKLRYTLSEEERLIRQLDSIPRDSMYYPKYLRSYPPSHPGVVGRVRPVENYVIYTDYSPRLEGDRRYRGANLPEVFVACYPYPENQTPDNHTYRKGNLPGFAFPAQFYNPDYSKQTPPEPTDYRRTLYWNPNLQLDEKGEARVTLWNNSRITHPNVEATGQTAEGCLLWTK